MLETAQNRPLQLTGKCPRRHKLNTTPSDTGVIIAERKPTHSLMNSTIHG
jgi:hypothetical protein